MRSTEGKKELNETLNSILALKESNNKVIQLILAGKTQKAIYIYEMEVEPDLMLCKKNLMI